MGCVIHSDLLGPNGEQWNNSEASNSRKMIKPTRLDSQWVCLEGAKTKVFQGCFCRIWSCRDVAIPGGASKAERMRKLPVSPFFSLSNLAQMRREPENEISKRKARNISESKQQ